MSEQSTAVDTALDILMTVPAQYRPTVMSLANGIADMEQVDRDELGRSLARVERYAAKRQRQAPQLSTPKRRGRPRKQEEAA